ncbi:MAG: hypothetical protein LBC97_08335 [Bifidobacteriaceae bacterium]|jgi:carboxypeptidase C (cathepsin A)|nr:hypothetical protein [Bifidobacteriaceae bacterium]
MSTAAAEAEPQGAYRPPPPSVTLHTLDGPQGRLRYQATAGYLDLVEEDPTGPEAKPPRATARVFLTSYVALPDESNPAPSASLKRPVVFVFNGGPGSSSAWLHLGLFGPRRVVALDGDRRLPPPPELVDNLETPLYQADLVLVDPVGTGFSRAIEGEDPHRHHGVEEDVESVSEVIRLWLARNGRWGSPVFIAGESYGVLRGTKIAAHLATRHGLYLAGLILISSSLGGSGFGPGGFLASPGFLPTYAAVAHYHGLHPGRELEDVVAEAERYTLEEYVPLLLQGNRASDEDRRRGIGGLAKLTGLSESFIDRANLLIDRRRFQTELLRDRGLVVGEIDGRITGWNPDRAAELPLRDPTDDALRGAYAAGINHYLRNELGFETDLPYEVLSDRVQPWKPAQGKPFGGFGSVQALGLALRTNPHLKIFYQLGYYDVCVPYFAAHQDLAELEIPEELRAGIRVEHYKSGHMIYVDEPSRLAETAHIAEFLEESGRAWAIARGKAGGGGDQG